MQEAFNMKRIIGLILVFCLVFSVFAEALAAPKWQIVQQTKCTPNEKKKTVTFTVKVKGNVKYQWVFVDPKDPNRKSTGKKIAKEIPEAKGLKVGGATTSKLTLSKVPEALHGWYVYCHLYSNAYKLDTDPVALQVPGMDPAPEPDKSQFVLEDNVTTPETTAPAATGANGQTAAPAEEEKVNVKKMSEEDAYEYVMKRAEGDLYVPELKEIKVSANGKYLYKLDTMGNPESTEGASSVTLIDSGNVVVKADAPLKSLTVNGIRFEPEEEVTSVKLFNINADTSVNLKAAARTVASASSDVDDSITYQITCTGCSFTYLPKGLKSAKEGEVPSGAVIYVFADKSDAGTATLGYTINGGEPQNLGATSFQLTVTGDMEIVAQ